MKYIIIDKAKAIDYGINVKTLLRKGTKVIVNENTLRRNIALSGTLEERVETLNGVIYDNEKIKRIIKQEKYGRL